MSKFSLFHDMASGHTCTYNSISVQAEKNHIRHQQHWLQLVTNSLNIAYISCTIFAHLAVCPRQRPKLTPTTNFPANDAQNLLPQILFVLCYLFWAIFGGVCVVAWIALHKTKRLFLFWCALLWMWYFVLVFRKNMSQ